MNDQRPAQIRPQHLQRLAVIYVRQSSLRQVQEHTGSTDHQRGQKEYALRWGWPPSAVEIVEDDLGMSGTSGDLRKGWQALLRRVAQGQVGMILAADSSRLTRSSADFEVLLGLCRATETLLAVEGVIVDPNESSNRLLARLRANVDEYENEQRTERFMKAKLTKVRQGVAVTRIPTGYVSAGQKGRWVKDPDSSVRRAIEEVFRQYEALGTVGKILRHFKEQGMQLPLRSGPGDLRWTRPTLARIICILRNPAFAGYYAYGQRQSVRGSPTHKRRRRDWQDCLVVENHHEAYVSPPAWHALIGRLKKNRLSHGPPSGDGPALCQGLVRCGRCGYRMSVHYYRRAHTAGILYVCQNAWAHFREARCWSVYGLRLDAVVAAEVLRSLAPPELEAVLAAADEVNAGYDAVRKQRQADLDRVEYEAKQAEKRYKQVDPDNRLVAATLEQDLERELERVREVKRRQAETPQAPPFEITPETLAAVQRVAQDLESLWGAPTTTNNDRKALVRLLVHEVRVVANSTVDFEIDIAWAGGAVSRHRVFRPDGGAVLCRRLGEQGLSKVQIAAELKRRGIVNRCGNPYSPSAVGRVLAAAANTSGLLWREYRETLRSPLTELFKAGWSDAEIAAEFNRRGFRHRSYDKPWNDKIVKVFRHRLNLRHPTGRRPRAGRNPNHQNEPEVTELT